MTIDMFVAQDADPRQEPSVDADEKDTLLGFQQWYRDTLDLNWRWSAPFDSAPFAAVL